MIVTLLRRAACYVLHADDDDGRTTGQDGRLSALSSSGQVGGISKQVAGPSRDPQA